VYESSAWYYVFGGLLVGTALTAVIAEITFEKHKEENNVFFVRTLIFVGIAFLFCFFAMLFDVSI